MKNIEIEKEGYWGIPKTEKVLLIDELISPSFSSNRKIDTLF